jgi:hypothetical protein
MSLRKELESAVAPRSGPRCVVCVALGKMDKDDADAFREWMRDDSKSAPLIAKAVTGYGFKMSFASVARHRREHV